MTSNVIDILQDALIYVGAYTQGQSASTDDLSLALRTINRKLDSLSAEKLSMQGLQMASYPLTGAASYAYGPGMVWNKVVRPIKLKAAAVQAPNGTQRDCQIVTADVFAAIPDKTRTGVFVEALMYDFGYPVGNIYVTPMPAAGTMVLWTYESILQFASTSGTVDLAPGYTQTLVSIAAVDLCIAFQRPLTQELAAGALQAKQVIVQLNAEAFNAPEAPPQGPGPTSEPAQRTS